MNIADAARRTLDDFVGAFRRLELEPFVALFCEDASVFYPTEKLPNKVVGRTEIATHFKEIFDGHRIGVGPNYLDLTPMDVDVVALGSGALVTFQLHRETGVGRRTILLVERDQGLQILHLHASNAISL